MRKFVLAASVGMLMDTFAEHLMALEPILGISNGFTRRSAALWRVLSDCYLWARKSSLRFSTRAIAERLVASGEVVRDY